MKLKRLQIQNFKSLRDITLEDPNDFLVFAGPQGSGKSNLVDAMDFMSRSLRLNPKEAVRHHGGWESVLNLNLDQKEFIDYRINGFIDPEFKDLINQTKLLELQYLLSFQPRKYGLLAGESASIDDLFEYVEAHNLIGDKYFDGLAFLKKTDWYFSIQNVRIYRINPALVLQPNLRRFDNSELDTWGQNLALVLNRLEQNDDIREQILEWMQMSVPELENVRTIEQKLDGHVGMLFKFKGYDKEFPPHLISEGTMYLLCMLVAVLDRPKNSISIIEEPERGLHPYLIQQLVEFFREESKKAPIWITTHNETLIRGLQPQELMLMDKVNGETVLKSVKDYKMNGLSLDQAWLTNILNGGLPW